jgi:iron uptake system EfeUOB component EfeO/EfeM
MTPRSLPLLNRRSVSAPAFVALTVLGALASACGNTTASRPTTPSTPVIGPEAGVTSRYGTDVGNPAAPTTALAHAATRDFAAEVQSSAAAFVNSVAALQTDTAKGDMAAAQADELAAQGEYDAVRALESGNSINASTLDVLDTDVLPSQSFGGLHAIERDLWSGGPLATDVAALVGQAPVAQYLLSRQRLCPEAIGIVAVDQLNWVAGTALPSSQEHTSHLGLVDVVATEQVARQVFRIVQPLAHAVDPVRTAAVAGQFVTLSVAIAALGPPTTTPDTSVTPTARLALTRQLDATATTLARLVAELAPFGTAGAPS